MTASQQQVTEEQESMELGKAVQIIGATSEDSIEKILSSFQGVYNDNLDLTRKEIILAKNTIVRSAISAQMKEKRFFEVKSPFYDSCMGCKGTGEIYKFARKPVEVRCHVCAGEKKIKDTCKTCKGSGRYKRSFPEGGGINVTCRTCNGEGELMVKCSHCRGEGTVQKIVPSHVIKSTTPCKGCDQLGFTSNKVKKKVKKDYIPRPIKNPVLDEDQCQKLSRMIKECNQGDADNTPE